MHRPLVALALLLAAGSCADDDDAGREPRVASTDAVVAVADHIEADMTGEVIVSDTSTLGVVIVSVVAEGNADAAVREVCLSAREVPTDIPVGLVVLAGDGSLVWETADSGDGGCPPG